MAIPKEPHGRLVRRSALSVATYQSVRRRRIRHWGLLLDARILCGTALHVLGLSFSLLRLLCLIPSPDTVEAEPTPVTAPEAAPRLQKQAA